MLTVGDKFPDFKLTALKPGLDGLQGPLELTITGQENLSDEKSSFCKITHNTDLGKWRVIFFWPKNFTFICPTEVIAFSNAFDEFANRGAVVYGVSNDSEYAHLYWRIHEKNMRNIKFHMISDIVHELVKNLGIQDKESGVALRATFIIDPNNIIKWVNVNHTNVGRNPTEALRVLDALLTNKLCQVDWHKGDEPLYPKVIFDDALASIDKAVITITQNIEQIKK